jgi:hypothetical protein
MDINHLNVLSIWTQRNACLFNQEDPPTCCTLQGSLQKRIWPCYSTVKKKMGIRYENMDQWHIRPLYFTFILFSFVLLLYILALSFLVI